MTRDSRSPEPPMPMGARGRNGLRPERDPISGLTAADFTVEADGKQQTIESCVYRADQPLRLAVILDDLSLSAARLEKARRALREFTAARLRPGDEAAILRTSSGAGALDRFTSDRDALRRRHRPRHVQSRRRKTRPPRRSPPGRWAPYAEFSKACGSFPAARRCC